MALSQDMAKAVNRLQMAECMHFAEIFENKPGQHTGAFIETIENVASMLSWRDSEKLICCKLKLKEEAQNVVRTCPQMKNTRVWDDFVAFLLKNFKTHKSSSCSFDKFFNCTQKSNKNVREYATRLRLAGCRTIADGPQCEAVGLRPSSQRFGLSRSAKTLEKALQCTEEASQNEQMSVG
ncbi:hypothetical protein PR048_006060, partial [Dryococelus australis]